MVASQGRAVALVSCCHQGSLGKDQLRCPALGEEGGLQNRQSPHRRYSEKSSSHCQY